MQKAEMGSVDVAFQRLQPVAFPLPRPEVGLVERAQHRLESGQWWRHVAFAHIDINQTAALGHLIGLRLDLVAEVLVRREIGHIEAVAGDVVFPAVVDTA